MCLWLTCLTSITIRYFVLLMAIVKCIVFLICLSVCLQFVYTRTTDFYELGLCLATLMKVFITCRFVVEFLSSFMYTIKDTLTSFFSMCTLWMSLSCLLALSILQIQYFKVYIKRYGVKGQHYLAPNFSGIALNFSLIWCWFWDCGKLPLLSLHVLLVSLISPGLWSGRAVGFC